jgi:hypothetical protein
MPDRELGVNTHPANRLQKANVERTAQFEASYAPVLDRDPIDQIASRPEGNVSRATAHASALNHATGFQPSRAGRSLLQLQKQYGNYYAEQVDAGLGGCRAGPDRGLRDRSRQPNMIARIQPRSGQRSS